MILLGFRFHAVYWPAILSALNLPMPKRIISHGHWTMDGSKMSKSLGNVVDPIEIVDEIFSGRPDPFRYFLLRSGKMNSDAPFSLEALKNCYNNELVGNLGNLISRVFKKYSPEEMATIPEIDRPDDPELQGKLNCYTERSDQFYCQFQYGQVADISMDIVSAANRYISRIEPWKFTDARDHIHIASQISCILKQVSSHLSPIIPESSDLIDLIMRGRGIMPLKGGLFPRLTVLNKSIRG
jgi:methionyl-tRNA synthetase